LTRFEIKSLTYVCEYKNTFSEQVDLGGGNRNLLDDLVESPTHGPRSGGHSMNENPTGVARHGSK
jgi:hypothetical protein